METQAVYQARPKMIEVKMPRYSLFFTEEEILSLLAKEQELWAKAIGRGKALLRNETARKREDRDFNRWEVYELLKGTMPIDDITIQQVERMDVRELREGIIEYLLVKRKAEVI